MPINQLKSVALRRASDFTPPTAAPRQSA